MAPRRSLFTGPKPRPAAAEPPYLPRNDSYAGIAPLPSPLHAPTAPIVPQTTPPFICTRQRPWQADPHHIKARHEKTQRHRGADSASYGFLSAAALPSTALRADSPKVSQPGFACGGKKNKAGKELKPLNHTGQWVPLPSFSTEGPSQALPGPAGAVQARLQLVEQEPDERYQQGPTMIPLARYLCASYLQNLQLFRRPTCLRH